MPNNTTSEPHSGQSALAALTDEWCRWRRADTGTGSQAEAMLIGVLSTHVMEALREKHGIQVESAAVTVARRETHHLGRNAKTTRGAALTDIDLDRLPDILAVPEAVLFDTQTGDSLIYVFTPLQVDSRKGKIAVRVNFTDRLKVGDAPRESLTTNSVRSAGYVRTGDLPAPRYDPLTGEVK